MELLNLQLFADDDGNINDYDYINDDSEIEDEASSEDNINDNGGNEADEQEEDLEIPEEFAGLSPEIAKEFTLKWKKQQDNIADDSSKETENQPINKEQSLQEKVKSLEAEVQQIQASQQQPLKTNTPEIKPFKPLQLNDLPLDSIKLLNKRAKEMALKAVGITEDQLDDLEYEDDGEQKKADYKLALSVAQNKLLTGVNSTLEANYNQQQAFIKKHNENMAAFKAYEDKQKKDANFAKIQEFAINDFFLKQRPEDQIVIKEAYARMEQNVGSPADRYTVEQYFEAAKRAYAEQNPTAKSKNSKQNKVLDKYKQAAKLPRTDKLMGAGGKDTETSIETAIRLLNEKSWEQIPKKYQNILLGVK